VSVEDCKIYNQLLSNNKRDIQLLGLGSNGHIGFNEPGTSFDTSTHYIALKESTIKDNAALFFNGDLDAVPKSAITMGIHNIMESKHILLIACGKRKAEAVKGMIEGEVTEELPASILQRHPHVTVIIDEEAASLLTK
jgi:glucosamine-6-phosphate deaminase